MSFFDWFNKMFGKPAPLAAPTPAAPPMPAPGKLKLERWKY